MSIYLLVTAVIFASCEKETDNLPANPAMNVQKNEIQSLKSIMDVKESGIDIQNYINSLPKQQNKTAKQSTSQRIENSGLQFFSNPEEFPCSNLPMEDFEEARTSWGNISNPLDEYSNNGIFQPGEILPGISITSSTDTFNYADLILSGAGGAGNNLSKAVFANYYVEYLVIDFTTSDVMSVSMKVLSYYDSSPDTTIDVYGFSGLIGQIIVTASSAGVYLGIASDEPISRITIHSMNNGAEGVDDISFGICNDLDGDGVLNENDLCADTPIGEPVNSNGCAQSQLDDDNDGVMNTVDSCSNTPSGEAVNENGCGQSQLDYDGDGVMNNKDAHIYSILGGVINIGGCYPNVNNKMVKNGSTMMDQIKDLTAQINSEYNGRNYTTLHSKFITKLAQITYNWRTARLITSTQRSQISSCAWGAAIPYYNNEN